MLTLQIIGSPTRLTPASTRRNLSSKIHLWTYSKKSCACDAPASAAPSLQSSTPMARFPIMKLARMLVRDDGTIAGTVGGGCVEAEVWAAAKDVIQKEDPAK